MMDSPDCRRHRQLLSDYACGRLEDGEALRAEELLDSCPDCAEWWTASFEGPGTEALDGAVEGVFADFVAPRQRRHRSWWAAAAAATVVLGVGALSQLGRHVDQPVSSAAAAPPRAVTIGVAEDTAISVLDFENGAVVASTGHAPEVQETIASMDFESGNLRGFTPST